jgi:hypothetical protein
VEVQGVVEEVLEAEEEEVVVVSEDVEVGDVEEEEGFK